MKRDTEDEPVTCYRCGDDVEHDRDTNLCGSCEYFVDIRRLEDGIQCENCNGHGRVYGTYCDIQRATNGRDTVCPVCDGNGRTAWNPEPEDVHPDLRPEVKARAE